MARLNGRVPNLGGPTREQARMAQIGQQIEALSLTIYRDLAGKRLSESGHSHIDVEKLKVDAKNSLVAAEAYFEGIGGIEPQ